MSGEDNKNFCAVTTINGAGELIPNAGKYSRGAIVVAFEMIGGVENFASWAGENQSEFYTKLFTKLVGRETEAKSTDDLEQMLEILDAEVIENPPQNAKPPSQAVRAPEPPKHLSRALRLAAAGELYSKNEPECLTLQ